MMCCGLGMCSCQNAVMDDGRTNAFTCLRYAMFSFQLVQRSVVRAGGPAGARGLEPQFSTAQRPRKQRLVGQQQRKWKALETEKVN